MSEADWFTRVWRSYLPALREAGGWAAQFEFYVRMSAEAIWGTGATDKDFEGLFKSIVDEIRHHLDAEQLDALTSLNLCQLRHDLLHCRSSKAYGKLGGKNNDPSVASVAEIGKDGSVLDTVMRAVTGGAVPVPQTKTADVGVMIWFVQLGATAKFQVAAKAFERACDALQSGLDARGRDGFQRALSEPPK